MTTVKKKLIETSLPLEAINAASAREKSIRHGHPSTLHLYWSRKPLATARAVLFAQLVDDPASRPEEFPTVESQDKERARLHALMEKLIIWETAMMKSSWSRPGRRYARVMTGNCLRLWIRSRAVGRFR